MILGIDGLIKFQQVFALAFYSLSHSLYLGIPAFLLTWKLIGLNNNDSYYQQLYKFWSKTFTFIFIFWIIINFNNYTSLAFFKQFCCILLLSYNLEDHRSKWLNISQLIALIAQIFITLPDNILILINSYLATTLFLTVISIYQIFKNKRNPSFQPKLLANFLFLLILSPLYMMVSDTLIINQPQKKVTIETIPLLVSEVESEVLFKPNPREEIIGIMGVSKDNENIKMNELIIIFSGLWLIVIAATGILLSLKQQITKAIRFLKCCLYTSFFKFLYISYMWHQIEINQFSLALKNISNILFSSELIIANIILLSLFIKHILNVSYKYVLIK
jgi:cytochrome bd-type quinol oxidase subunit 1